MKSFLAQLATSHSMICLDLCVCLSFKRFTILSPLKPVTLFNRYFAGMMFVFLIRLDLSNENVDITNSEHDALLE